MSRSRSRSISPVVKRPIGLQPKDKYVRGKRPPPSDSDSSSSSSSDDGDVLQLHARKGRSSSLSYSDSQSSSSRSRSPSRPRRAQHRTSSSSSGSGSSSDTESDESVRNKPKANPPPKVTKAPAGPVKTVSKSSTQQRQTTQGTKKPAANAVSTKNKKPSGNKSDSDSSSSSVVPIASTTVNRKPSTGATAATSKEKQKQSVTAPETGSKTAKTKTSVATTKPSAEKVEKEKTPPVIKKPAPKSASESGETETETESSSDSDSEPRMTLSERFSKLQHTNTDKREMAKPVLSVNEIDTKMKVVKDFRNPDIPKVYVTGHGAMDKSFSKVRPKTPEYSDGEKRFASEERRRHFERMYRDEPVERPLDWSDARVRYNYYKERGCFDERPISLDEYVKWEDWYHKYREWLEREGYYDRMAGGPVGGGPPPMGNGNWPPQPQYGPGPGLLGQGPGQGPDRMRPNYPQRGRRVDHIGGGPPAPLSSRAHFGRPEGDAYLQGSIGRRIDRTPGGSLVVNIHPGNNVGGGRGGRPGKFVPRGRRLGRGLGRPR